MKRRKPRVKKIILLRHAEKPAKDLVPYGVTQTGKRDKESLQVRGWQRAGALTSLFAPLNNRSNGLLAKPQFLYASKPLKRQGSKRPLETLTPLAEKLAIRINFKFPRFDFESMLEEVFSRTGVVMICWQREYIPAIALSILGDATIAPSIWPEDCFDMIWVFDLDQRSGRFKFKQVPQKLLMGDRTTPIT